MPDPRAAAPGADRAPTPLVLRGRSDAVAALRARVREIGRTDRPVVIWGEPGSGRGALARAVHQCGRRALAPLVAVRGPDPGAEVLAREIFGYVRAAVPGAAAARAGFVHSAAGGSLLIEGVPAFDPGLLEAVVSAAASGRARMLGASEGQPFDLRLMLASDLDAAAMVLAAEPWSSLPSRLTWMWIAVPPLRDRAADLAGLMAELLAAAAAEQGRPVPELSVEAGEAVASYGWPGNLVEMRAAARRLVATATGSQIGRRELPPAVRAAAPGDARTLAEVEADHVRAVLARCGGNRSEAARRLGIDRKTLRSKLADPGAAGGR